MGAETAFPGASKFENLILLSQLVFELEQFELDWHFSFFGWGTESRNRLPPKFTQRMFHVYPIYVLTFKFLPFAVLKLDRFRPLVAEKPLILHGNNKGSSDAKRLGLAEDLITSCNV